MDIKALQARLRDFAAARDWQSYHSPKNLAMALMVEAAELLELFQWKTITESCGFTRNPSDKERVADEIADVLLYLLQLADHTDVDVEQAVEHKLRKNAQKHPAKHPEPLPSAPAPAAPKVHLLVDWENVQPTGNALKALVPEGTDVWLFHGPHQKVDDSSHRSTFGDGVTQVPRSGAGKNALDFQLTYYVGYISARQPAATFVVVSNDQGYDPMLEHVRELGFKARRCGFHKPVPKTEEAQVPQVVPAPASAPALPMVATAKQKTPAKAADLKATRQDVKKLAQMLQGMEPWERPGRRDALLVLLQAHMGESSMVSPRVAHALAQLQAQKHVAIKGEQVSYPVEPATPAPPAAAPAAKKKAAAKKAAIPTQTAAPAKTVSKPTPAQIALAVLASLKKMPKNKPTRHAGLLKFIETHAAKATDPKAMSQQVCALLEARKDVVVSPNGKDISYPKIGMKKAAGA
jgi:NTP pyrophosphatase (non-canonical NTP hydrolase)